MSEWFDVRVVKPECPRGSNALGVPVLIWPRNPTGDKYNGIDGHAYYGRRATGNPTFYKHGVEIIEVTHWMPMPKGPVLSCIEPSAEQAPTGRAETLLTTTPAPAAGPSVVCHAPGDRCFGCGHYHGKLPRCEYEPAAVPDDPVLWGEPKQAFPGGPVYRVGVSTDTAPAAGPEPRTRLDNLWKINLDVSVNDFTRDICGEAANYILMLERENAALREKGTEPAVAWGEPKQAFPGGPVYRVGASTDITPAAGPPLYVEIDRLRLQLQLATQRAEIAEKQSEEYFKSARHWQRRVANEPSAEQVAHHQCAPLVLELRKECNDQFIRANEWHNAALGIGEKLASSGPDGYEPWSETPLYLAAPVAKAQDGMVMVSLELLASVKKCVQEMRDENKLHGHITDASAKWAIRIEPLLDAAMLAKEGK